MPVPPNPSGSSRRLLTCGACGRVEVCSPTELLLYTQSGWPTCCWEVMAFSIEPARGGNDTRPDHPPLRGGMD